MPWRIERSFIFWGFLTALAILMFAGWQSYQNTKTFAETTERTDHTYQVLRTLDKTVALLVDAETGQRGYLLTGSEAYLEPYREAIKNLDEETVHLKDLTADNPSQQKRIQILEPLIEKKLEELQRTIDLRREHGEAAANEVVLGGSGKKWMDQIRASVREVKNEETDLLRLRAQRADESMARSARAIVAGSLASISLLTLCFVFLSRELSERKRAQMALEKSEKWLSTTLGSIGDAVIATDMNGAVTFMNPVAQSLTGWKLGEGRGKSMDLVFDIVNKETRRPVENPVKKVFREGKVVGLADHTLLISRNGKEFDIEDSAAPIATGAGESLGVVLVFRDVTELKQVREELDRYFTLAVDMFCIAGSDGYFKRVNPAWQKTLGFTPEELMAKPYLEFIHPDDRERTIQEGEKQGKGQEVISFHNRFLCKDGSYKWLSWSATPFIEQKLIYAVARDITELKQAEQALRLSEERYRLFFESNPHPVWVYDLESLAILDVNAAAIRNYGYSHEEFLTLSIKDIRPAEDVPVVLESVARAKAGLDDKGTWRHRKKDGALIDVEITSHPLVYNGRNARLVVSTDITQRRQAEEALKASEQRLNLALDAAQLGIWELDLVNDKAYRNLRHDQIFGYASLQPDWGQEIFLTHVFPEDREAAQKSFEKAFVNDDFSMECRIVWPDRSIHWISARGRVFRNGKGDPVRMMGTVADVTGRKQAQEVLVQAKEEAERSNKFKDQFLSTMSHELRTPLNAVLGFSDLLTEEQYGPLNDRQKRYVKHIQAGGHHLLRLINDILDLSKIEAGRLQLTIESVPVGNLFAHVADAMRPLADKKSQTLSQDTPPDRNVLADDTRLKQILMNLIGNAIKFTPEGGKIALRAYPTGEVVRVEVRDSGPGIPLEEQKRIFEAFYQLGRSEKVTEGTGLGLAITRRLVELHGGHLGIESKPGWGSCFFFTLPIAPAPRNAPQRNSAPLLKPRNTPKILVVEDDSKSAQLLHSQLTSAGYEVVLCHQPQRALDMAAELQPSAITLDIIMKPISGWELLPNLKSDPRTAAIPVIVVTIVDQPAAGALVGAEEYIVKPVLKADLLAAVARCLNRRGTAGRPRPILVIEDDSPTREFIAELLSKHGYAVGTAAEGTEARALIAKSLPELVILDLILPGVSGFELLAEWRGDARTAELPVLVLTSKDLTPGEREYLRTNACALFLKQELWQEALLRQVGRVVPPVLAENL
jgi:PAS domain S-box-containing protein